MIKAKARTLLSKSSDLCVVSVLTPLSLPRRKKRSLLKFNCTSTWTTGSIIIVIAIIWCVLYLLGCILWFCHPCQHQPHSGSYSSALNLPSYTCPLTHELDHLWSHYPCTLFGGCGHSQSSRVGNCLAPPSTAVAFSAWVPSSIWLFWAWYWVRGRTGAGECVLYCYHLLISYMANVLLGMFWLKHWVSIIRLFCNLLYVRKAGTSYLA